jgi:hypothetical protein
MHVKIMFHAYSDIYVYTKTVSRKKKGGYQSITLNPGNGDHKTSQAVDWGSRTPSTSNIFTRLQISFLLLSNTYSKGEHLSYSASLGERMNAKAL